MHAHPICMAILQACLNRHAQKSVLILDYFVQCIYIYSADKAHDFQLLPRVYVRCACACVHGIAALQRYISECAN